MNEKQFVWPIGIKKTKPRKYVLMVLEKAEKPLSASDIYHAIEKMNVSISLSTIYRILELFEKKEVVVKMSIMNKDMAIYELKGLAHKHYAICTNCHKVITMNCCPIEKYSRALNEAKFHVTGHKIEIYGCCKECFQKTGSIALRENTPNVCK